MMKLKMTKRSGTMRADITRIIMKHAHMLVSKKNKTKNMTELRIMLARTAAAYSFYKYSAGYSSHDRAGYFNLKKILERELLPASGLDERIQCIDFHHQVKITELETGTTLQQFVGNYPGRFYSNTGSTPSQLGIHHSFKDKNDNVIKAKRCEKFLTAKPIEVLKSVAAPAKDTWSIKGQVHSTTGGAPQFFVPRRNHGEQIKNYKKFCEGGASLHY